MSIKAKFLLVTTGLVMFLGFVIMLLVSTYLYNRLVREVQERTVVIGNTLAERCVDPILSRNYYRLATLLIDETNAQKSIDYAFVVGNNGKVLADTFGGNFPVDLLTINSLHSAERYRIADFEEGGNTYYDIAFSILQPPIGTVHLGISESPIREDVWNILRPIILIVIVALILSTIAAILFSQYITRPISVLAGSVDAIRNGDFENRAVVHTNDEAGRLADAFNEMADELNATLTRLANSERMFRMISYSANDAVLMIDQDGKIIVWNEAATNLFGYTAEEAIGKEAISVIVPVRSSDEQVMEFASYMHPGEHKTPGVKLEMLILTKSHSRMLVEISLSSLQMDGKWNLVGIVRDITGQKELEGRLTSLSYLDGLTNIYNRRSFDEQIKKECRRAQREQLPLSVFMIDIDFFKEYNDTYGHHAGDECLKKVVRAIKRSLNRPGDYLARYGGEEFVIIAPNTDIEGAGKLAENIRLSVEAMKIPHASSSVCGLVTCSIGVTTRILDKADLSTTDLLVSQADQALYQAKNTGRNRVCIY